MNISDSQHIQEGTITKVISIKWDDDDRLVNNPNESITNIVTSFNKSIKMNDNINNNEIIHISKNNTKSDSETSTNCTIYSIHTIKINYKNYPI